MTLPTRIFAETMTDGETSSGVWNARRLTTTARAYVPEDDAQNAMLEQMREALEQLEREVSNTIRLGAQTGPHWSKLTGANLRARAILKAMEATQ